MIEVENRAGEVSPASEPVSLGGVEESLRRVTDENWEAGSLDVDFTELGLDPEELRREIEEECGPEAFEGRSIGDYLDPAGTIRAYHAFREDDGTWGSVHMRVDLLPGGAVGRCNVSELGRRAWLDVGREVPTPMEALRMFRIKYGKKKVA